ncbi:hypothetical protein Hte_011156 [Hypoxylon texense]
MTSALSAMGSSPPTTFASWENGPAILDRMRNERDGAPNQPVQEGDAGNASMMAEDTMIIESRQELAMQEMERTEMGVENENLSMHSTENMGFYQFDSFESDLLVAFANGDTQFGLPLQ